MDLSGICYLCWKPCDPNKYREHVPPKGCFPKGSENLITICCCESCNNANSAEDEYFRMVMACVPQTTKSSAAVWEKVLERTVKRGRLRKDVSDIISGLLPVKVDGLDFAQFEVRARRLRLQLIRITKGFIRHYYPIVNYRDFEWHVMRIDQFKITSSMKGVSGILKYHERGGGAHQLLYGIAEDCLSFGIWLHVFHGGHAFAITHRLRIISNRKHSGKKFKV